MARHLDCRSGFGFKKFGLVRIPPTDMYVVGKNVSICIKDIKAQRNLGGTTKRHAKLAWTVVFSLIPIDYQLL